MATQTFYRKATVSRADATASLFNRFPDADLVSFEQKTATADEAAAAGAKEGDAIFAATIRVAEFPPSDDESGSDDSGESAPPKKEEKTEEKPEGDDSESSDDGGESPAPEFGGEGGPEGHEPKKLSPEEETNHLLQQILDALRGGAGPAGPDAAGPDAGLDLPDVGAPGQGDALPPPGGPAAGGAPLPPPVKQKSPVGVGAFAHYDPKQAEITVARAGASEVGNRGMIAEAAEVYPTHTVAKIQRTGSAVINGEEVNLAEKNLAVVTLVAK